MNLIEAKVPYSAKAVEDLIALEREHYAWNLESSYKYDLPLCPSTSCISSKNPEINAYPCYILRQAREHSSKETLIAVALILSGDNNG